MEGIKDLIKQVFGISEGYQLPGVLMETLMNETRRKEVFDIFSDAFENDFSYDWFTDYFMEEHADRKDLMQDYTPDGLCSLMGKIIGESDSVADICAGTGGLTIKTWNNHRGAFFHCEELSERALPILLFNLAIRGITGEIVHGDVLTRKITKVYKLTPAGKYSDISEVETPEARKYKAVVMNPPYSVKWDPVMDERFEGYGLAPKGKADYAFLLHGLHLMHEDGKLVAILPHGVLFRGSSESKIREKLIKKRQLDAVIGVADKLFLKTAIPVCLICLRNGSKDTLVINADKLCEEGKKQNYLKDSHIEKIYQAYLNRKPEKRFSRTVTVEEFQKNDFNLNIPRYVNTLELEPPPDVSVLLSDMRNIDGKSKKAREEMRGMTSQLTSTTQGEDISVLLNDRRSLDDESEEVTEEMRGMISQLTSTTQGGNEALIFMRLLFSADRRLEERSRERTALLGELSEKMDDLSKYPRERKTITEITTFERAKKGKVYPAGSILIQMSATRGQMKLLDEPQLVEEYFGVFSPASNLCPPYLFNVMQARVSEFLQIYQDGLNIKPDIFKFWEVEYPSLETQKQIADILESVDRIIEVEERERALLEQSKKLMLHYMFPREDEDDDEYTETNIPELSA